MNRTVLGFIVWCVAGFAGAAPLQPGEVAVVYNSASEESGKLARLYCELRKVPETNLIGLKLPLEADISREDFEKLLRKPLRAAFDERAYWEIGRDGNGVMLPVRNRIRVILTVRGVPLRINPVAKPANYKPDPKNPIAGRDEASVDSELSLVGVDGLPIDGGLDNKYFKRDVSISEAGLPFVMLIARLDAASFATCERMLRDAVETEKNGLWGMAYVDLANKAREGEGFKIGDDWLEGVVSANLKSGIPTVVDRFNDTLPKNYPMGLASLYYGWYDWHASGPFLNPAFKFHRGAVAAHIHSFSAQQLGNATQNWCAPLLEKGAAATVGNVFEPYLHLTHYLDVFHQRLLSGMTLVEAAWAAMPVASWQGVVLGDPLYRPFARLDGNGPKAAADTEFIALRLASLKWGEQPVELRKQLLGASERMKSGVIAEALGLRMLVEGKASEAKVFFDAAKQHYPGKSDKIRQEFHQIATLRAAPDGKARAVQALREARIRYGGTLPESAAFSAWLDILDPPPPPAVVPAAPAKAK